MQVPSALNEFDRIRVRPNPDDRRLTVNLTGIDHTESDQPAVLKVQEPFAPITVAADWFNKHAPQVGGYYVVYDDGYKSFSPAKAFEEGYTLKA